MSIYLTHSLLHLFFTSVSYQCSICRVLYHYYQKRMAELETKKLYVKNLDWNLTEDNVKDYFSQFGEIASIKLPLDKFKRRRGFAFVEYVNDGEAEKALSEANGKSINGTEREMSVEMARAEDPEEREARYAARKDRFQNAPSHHVHNKFDEDQAV